MKSSTGKHVQMSRKTAIGPAQEGTRSAMETTSTGRDDMPSDDSGTHDARGDLRNALHAINNSLHVLGLQAELARLHLENGNLDEARTALQRALEERSNCGRAVHGLQQLVHAS